MCGAKDGGGMIVEGVQVSEETIATAVARARSHATFTYSTLQGELVAAGCDKAAAYRAADRVLQKLKKAGQLAWKGSRWEWIQ